MTENEKIQFLEKSLERLLVWIERANSITNFLFTISTAMLGVLVVTIPALSKLSTFSVIFLIISSGLLIICLFFSSLVNFPRTKGPAESNIFFGSISKEGAKEYRTKIINLTHEKYISDLINQCYRNSEIADIKYRWLKRSIATLYISSIPWIITIYTLLQSKQ